MAAPRYKVTHPSAPRVAADPAIRDLAGQIRDAIAARTPHGPTGDLAASWTVTKGRATAAYLVGTPLYYAMFVEYGTADMSAEPMAGPVIAEYRARVSRR